MARLYFDEWLNLGTPTEVLIPCVKDAIRTVSSRVVVKIAYEYLYEL